MPCHQTAGLHEESGMSAHYHENAHIFLGDWNVKIFLFRMAIVNYLFESLRWNISRSRKLITVVENITIKARYVFANKRYDCNVEKCHVCTRSEKMHMYFCVIQMWKCSYLNPMPIERFLTLQWNRLQVRVTVTSVLENIAKPDWYILPPGGRTCMKEVPCRLLQKCMFSYNLQVKFQQT